MKTLKLFASLLVFTFTLHCTQVKAQSSGIAADKQKQENLEKNKARQAELKKKYNSLTPEQAAEAKKKANEYKKGGYKEQAGKGTKTSPSPTPKPATNKVDPSVNPAKPSQSKPSANKTATPAKTAPIFLDANGKPVEKKATPAAPANKTVLKTPTPPAQNPTEKAPATNPNKK
jgi:hypothetical protein